MKKSSCSKQARIMLNLGIILAVLSSVVTISAATPVIGQIGQVGSTVTIPVTATASEEVTNLVYKGPTAPAQGNIIYINQQTASATDGTTSFVFTAPAGTVGTYNIKVGSTSATAPATQTVTFAPDKPAVPGGVTSGGTVTLPSTVTLTKPADTATITYSIYVKVGAGSYSLYTAPISAIGTYTAKITAAVIGELTTKTDSDEITFTVAETPDTIAPVITLNGDATVNVVKGASYTDASAAVTDNKDNGLTVTVAITNNVNGGTTFDSSVEATYTFTYSAVDAAGNHATPVTRTVIVKSAGVIVKGNATPANSTIGDPTEDAKIAVHATLYNSNSEVVASTVADTTTGDYQFNDVAPGTYTVELLRRGAVKKNPIPVDTANAVEGVVDLGTTQLYIGDMDENGFIDETDAYAVVPYYYSVPGDGVYDPIYDMDMNGFIDETDAYAVVPYYYYVDNQD